MSAKLHYIFDPLCGWCYAASPLLTALKDRFGDELELVFHPGLLFAAPREIDQPYRDHIISADLRIAALAGVEFGAAYIKRVRTAPVLRYHSELPAAAVMAINALNPARGLRMLELIQQSHYQQGEDVSDMTILSQFAQTLGVAVKDFAQALENIQHSLPSMAIEARNLMQAVGGNGFPTLVLEQDGELQKLDHSSAYGKPYLLANRVAQFVAA
ncbi:MAG: DsbA family protein [Cellvibrio sp.]|uniref:DsbA family protein n=1 Tax=Cellvibrio sp. TaxID=1965322 RepID=UPI002719D1C8|nr:DsbA family protein [Cellvibrio sp.]